jgi:hypothetical protein
VSSESDGDDDDKKRHPSLDFNGTGGLEDMGGEEQGRCGVQWAGAGADPTPITRGHHHLLIFTSLIQELVMGKSQCMKKDEVAAAR